MEFQPDRRLLLIFGPGKHDLGRGSVSDSIEVGLIRGERLPVSTPNFDPFCKKIPSKMEKFDLTKLHKTYFSAKTVPEIVDIEAACYLSILGKGDPSSEAFAADIQALYPVAYAIKFACKEVGKDFTVSKLEGQWWFDEQKFGAPTLPEAPQKVPRSEWEYRLLIRMPDFVDAKMVASAVASVISKKKMPTAARVHFFEMTEGKCVQMLHVGAFADEPVSLQKMLDFMLGQGMLKNGLHHEIYLSDFRKTAPEDLKTILREPFKIV